MPPHQLPSSDVSLAVRLGASRRAHSRPFRGALRARRGVSRRAREWDRERSLEPRAPRDGRGAARDCGASLVRADPRDEQAGARLRRLRGLCPGRREKRVAWRPQFPDRLRRRDSRPAGGDDRGRSCVGPGLAAVVARRGRDPPVRTCRGRHVSVPRPGGRRATRATPLRPRAAARQSPASAHGARLDARRPTRRPRA
jgi:hypothetical protein